MTDITLTRKAPSLSIVICTYNEADCIEDLIQKIKTVVPEHREFELIIVDDSTDSTPQIIDSMAEKSGWIRLLHRSPGQRNGLGGAIITGIKAARGTYVLVMDGDGQHPPELIEQLLRKAQQGYDFVLPSRYINGGSSAGLSNSLRSFYSRVLRMLPRWLFTHRIGSVSDPLSGYFLFKRDIIDIHRIHAESWKILLELLLFARWKNFAEVPYSFQERKGGESKASIRVGIDYITHLFSLTRRFYFSSIHQPDFAAPLSVEGDRQ